MAKPRSRKRRETVQMPTGIGGLPPFPLHGSVAALRVLGHGFELPLDLGRAEFRVGRVASPSIDVELPLPSISGLHALIKRDRDAIEVIDQGSKNGIGYDSGWGPHNFVRSSSVVVRVGERVALARVILLALDAPTYEVVAPLAAYCGPGNHDDVDRALEAVIRGHLMILCGSRADDVAELASTLHAHSVRKGYPFTRLDAVPHSDQEIDDLCTRAGCGTILLDLTRPFDVPLRFARHLFSEHFHLWTMIVAPTVEQAALCLGNVWGEPRRAGLYICDVGFFRHRWHLRMTSPSFTPLH